MCVFQKMTEGRVLVFNHDVVPNYLRTKAEPDVEEKIQQLTTKTQLVSQDTIQVMSATVFSSQNLSGCRAYLHNLNIACHEYFRLHVYGSLHDDKLVQTLNIVRYRCLKLFCIKDTYNLRVCCTYDSNRHLKGQGHCWFHIVELLGTKVWFLILKIYITASSIA